MMRKSIECLKMIICVFLINLMIRTIFSNYFETFSLILIGFLRLACEGYKTVYLCHLESYTVTMCARYLVAHSRDSETFVDFREKSASLLDHISRFLSHQFVTWYLRNISKTKIVKLFCPWMSEHMIYIKNVINVTQTLHQNVTNVTKQNIASKEILTIEFHTKYMKLFVNMLSVICALLNTKFHNTSVNFYFEVILSRTIVSCKVTNVTNRYMDFILDLDEEFNFQRPVCLDSNRMHYYQSNFVDSMFVPGAVAIQK